MASVKLLSSFLFSVVILINRTGGGRPSGRLNDHYYLDHCICKFNPKFAVNGSCSLSFITRFEKAWSVNAVVVRKVDNVMARFQLLYKFRNGYHPLLLDVTANACAFLSGKEHSKVLAYVFGAMIPYSPTNMTCPFKGPFIITKAPINMGTWDNVFLPAGNYLFNATLSVGNEFIWNGKFYFILPEGKTVEDDRMG